MTFTPRQGKELSILDFFPLPRAAYTSAIGRRTITPATIHEDPSGDPPEVAYFAITDAGYKLVMTTDATRLYQLLDAKRWRHRHIEMYEDGVLEGTVPYAVLLDETPRPVAEYLSREMFKGSDKALILGVHENLAREMKSTGRTT